jgi:hypothetical protein
LVITSIKQRLLATEAYTPGAFPSPQDFPHDVIPTCVDTKNYIFSFELKVPFNITTLFNF